MSTEDAIQKVIDDLDTMFIKFVFECKLKGMSNVWIYQQVKAEILKQPKEFQDIYMMWLDNRWGEYKLY